MPPSNLLSAKIVKLARILELSNDVEKNPGPPKIIKNGLIPPLSDTNVVDVRASSLAEDGLFPQASMELDGLREVIAKQADVICSQKVEIEHLRKLIEKNLELTRGFQSEISELRRNWQVAHDGRKLDDNPTGMATKLEALASAYNDIQDRLHELDKSWKNNLMIYGVPSEENFEEDPIITEEKVINLKFGIDIEPGWTLFAQQFQIKEVLAQKLFITREIPVKRVSRINYGPDFRGHRPIQVWKTAKILSFHFHDFI